ncbi:TPA: hypothetical protein ACH3X1_007999 [Trebouxia sp. C0004]
MRGKKWGNGVLTVDCDDSSYFETSFPICSVSHKRQADIPFPRSLQGSGSFMGPAEQAKMLGRLQRVRLTKYTEYSSIQHPAKTLQMQCSQAAATDAFVKQEASLKTEAVLFCYHWNVCRNISHLPEQIHQGHSQCVASLSEKGLRTAAT